MGVLITDKSGTRFNPTLLWNIQHRYNAEIFSALRDVDPSELKDSVGMTLLHFAAEYGHDEFARYLMNLGTKVDAQNQAQETPLSFAVEYNQLEIVKILLEADADIFVPNVYGQCALGKALRDETNVTESIAKALLSKVTSESLRDSKYITSAFHVECPLYHFVALRNADITRVLLEKGSPVNVQNPSNGDTPLHVAVREQDWENVKLLMKYNANYEMKNQVGIAPLKSISLKDNEDCSTMLEVLTVMVQAGCDYDRCAKIVHGVLSRGNREIVREALPWTIDLYAKSPPVDECALGPFFYVCTNKIPDIHEELRSFEFDANARCSRGSTILHWAVKAGNPGTVKFLLSRGADVNAENTEGNSPLKGLMIFLMFVMCSLDATCDTILDEKRFKNCVEILLEHDADHRVFMGGNDFPFGQMLQREISNEFLAVIEPLLTRVALVEVEGSAAEPYMRSEIASVKEFEKIFLLNRQHLEEMKNIGIDDGVNLLDFYAESERKMSRFALNRRLVSNVEHAVMTICTEDSYCHYKLCERFLKVNALVILREKVATTLKAIIREFCDVSVCNIADKIVNYVSDKNLCRMV